MMVVLPVMGAGRFAVPIPDNISSSSAAPMFCAGGDLFTTASHDLN